MAWIRVYSQNSQAHPKQAHCSVHGRFVGLLRTIVQTTVLRDTWGSGSNRLEHQRQAIAAWARQWHQERRLCGASFFKIIKDLCNEFSAGELFKHGVSIERCVCANVLHRDQGSAPLHRALDQTSAVIPKEEPRPIGPCIARHLNRVRVHG